MNILIPDSWLRDLIRTSAKPKDISKALSLHAFSVEKTIECDDGDVVYEIEITPNRGDALSIMGIARELVAILPDKGFSAEWIKKPAEKFKEVDENPLTVEIMEDDLVPRFSAVVLKDIISKPSPDLVASRLEKVGIRALNAVVDMTNYLMIETGQPMHIFDYDKIKGHKMVVRQSHKGEKLITLDGVERTLPAGVIVIEDGEGRLIDLCGIMGCKNSEVDENTTKALFFVQIYNPVRIRKASMTLGHRTDAALRFEKGVDFEGVLPGLYAGVEMLAAEVGSKIASKLTDIAERPKGISEVYLDHERIKKIAGTGIDNTVIENTLGLLGFEVLGNGNVRVPSWRFRDILIPEDLAEEVIRVYGYYNLKDNLLTGEIPAKKEDKRFYWEDKAKDFLRFNGLYECYTNSATTETLAGDEALGIANPLSQDLSHLRTSLVPQLLEVMDKNKGSSGVTGFFEMSAVYLPVDGDLPDQPMHLALVTRGMPYRDLKGIVESMLLELGIKDDFTFEIETGLDDVLYLETDFDKISALAKFSKTYTSISRFNSIKEDLTFVIPEGVTYDQIRATILLCDNRITKLSFKDFYNNAMTLSIEYLDKDAQVSSQDTQEIRAKIFIQLEKSLKVSLKS
ncbi:MAG: phenylalanine--tRNA ligase subunit beta [Patescibacteria group bacterium]|jgi:phenylalanyl-tRNA synthetase beta chain